MSTKIFNIVIKLAKEGGADKDTVKGLLGIKNAMTTGMAVAGAMVGTYYAIDKALDATVGKFVALTGEVEQFRNQTGMSAEDSSRLLEVMKDLEISAESVGTAFKFAEKNGFEPNLQSLEAMQAKYQALNPGMERTQFLIKEFGKSGLSLQKFFETGDIAQRLGEVNQAMIISDESIASVQEYKDNVDAVKDAWEGIKLHAGQVTLPIVLRIITEAAGLITAKDTVTVFTAYNKELIAGSKNFADYHAQEQAYLNQHPEVVNALIIERTELHGIGAATYADTEATMGNIYAKEKLTTSLQNEEDKLIKARNAQNDLTTAQGAAATSAEEIKTLIDQINWETAYTGAEDFAERSKSEFDLLGQGIQGIEGRGAEIWNGLLSATGKISPAAIAEFVKIQVVMEKIQAMAAAGMSVDVIINYIQTQSGISLQGTGDPFARYSAFAPADTGGPLHKHMVHDKEGDFWWYVDDNGWSKTGYKALGGVFSEDVVGVGERGEEWLVRNAAGQVVVLPNDMVRRLEDWGFAPGRGFRGGGEIDQYGALPAPPKTPQSSNLIYYPNSPYALGPGQGINSNPNSYLTGNNNGFNVTSPYSGSSSAAAAVAAVEAVSPVVTDAMQGFQAAQQVSTQANTAQVAQQTHSVEEGNATQAALLRQLINTIEGLAEQLAVELQKRR